MGGDKKYDQTEYLLPGSAKQSKKFVPPLPKNFRKHSKTPIILMGYTNSFIQPSIDNFCKNAKDVGINGFLIVDLPYSETEIINTIQKYWIDNSKNQSEKPVNKLSTRR